MQAARVHDISVDILKVLAQHQRLVGATNLHLHPLPPRTPPQIAGWLTVSVRTVEGHLYRVHRDRYQRSHRTRCPNPWQLTHSTYPTHRIRVVDYSHRHPAPGA